MLPKGVIRALVPQPPKIRIRAFTLQHRTVRRLAGSIAPFPVGFVPRHAVRRLRQNRCSVVASAAGVQVLLDGRRLKEHPSCLRVGDDGLASQRGGLCRTVFCPVAELAAQKAGPEVRAVCRPVPDLPAAEARGRFGAVRRQMPTLIAVAANQLRAIARPMAEEPAPQALIARAGGPTTRRIRRRFAL